MYLFLLCLFLLTMIVMMNLSFNLHICIGAEGMPSAIAGAATVLSRIIFAQPVVEATLCS